MFFDGRFGGISWELEEVELFSQEVKGSFDGCLIEREVENLWLDVMPMDCLKELVLQ